jgi:hypothetical protein
VRVSSLFETIVSYFEQDGWEFTRLPGHQAVEMGAAGEHGNYRLIAVVEADHPIVRFLTFVEGKVPEARRREVMEFLTRANYGLLLGNFEFDVSDGEVRFKCSADLEDAELTHAQFSNLLLIGLTVMDRYFPGLQRVIQGTADPAAAIAEAET